MVLPFAKAQLFLLGHNQPEATSQRQVRERCLLENRSPETAVVTLPGVGYSSGLVTIKCAGPSGVAFFF